MAYQKQIWENLPSQNTPLSADRLNHMEDGIYDAYEHGGGGETLPVGSEIDFDGQVSEIPTGWEQVDDVPVYSTTETICGTWIDGSEVYKKVVNMGNLANNSSKSVAHGIIGNFKLIGLNGGATYGTTNIWATGFNDEIYIAGDNVVWNTRADRRNFTGYIILEYIKVSSS